MIEIKNLCKRYGENIIYQDFNLSFKENKITCLVGPSGCGKTTLFRILAGLETYESGKIIGEVQKDIAYIFQEDRLIPWLSVYENIRFVLKSQIHEEECRQIIKKVLKHMELWEYRDYMPRQLSGGMQRRVAIGRAFAYKSEVLLMDEPFKGLDKDLKKTIMNELLELWRENPKTIIWITHQLEEAEVLSDCIIELVGKPVAYRILR